MDREIQNTGHTIIFMLLSILSLKGHRIIYPNRVAFSTYINVFILLNIIGLTIELIQINSARDADFFDLLRNNFGIISLFCIDYIFHNNNSLKKSRKKSGIIFIASITVIGSLLPIGSLFTAYYIRNNSLPIITQFNSYFFRYFYSTYHAHIYNNTIFHTDMSIPRSYSLVVLNRAKFSGLAITEPMPNWQKYNAICFKIYTIDTESFEISLRINDIIHNNKQNDRFNHKFVVNNKITKHCIKLSDIENSPKHRIINLKKITNIQIFKPNSQTSTQFYLSNIWLE